MKEEGRRKKEEGRRRKKEEGRRKKEEGRRKKEEGRRKKEEGRRKKEGEHLSFASVVLSPLASYTSSHCKKMFFAKMRCSRRKKLNCRVCRP
ncbi:MAG: hypothetical protein JGK32_29335 [Microcoleus sp. PH2017_31_RDM_U_A]|uniref:hypothetical protein n=1 Tax=Microcoleus sp. PH2017_31_RDM_U_A TaxID=2798841 RepID=UPI001E0A298F|nr:hypothetical protein [Microcoleus sp. PH2017_31_RDM_U_A]MCC3569332.1 hypothetical protein [Microcoleus sp. PH2017_31_RDM_U_A]